MGKYPNRKEIRNLGKEELGVIVPQNPIIKRWKSWLESYQFNMAYIQDDYSWFVCVLALKAVNSGNFGVGSVLVDSKGKILVWGHNEVFNPFFHSDRHAEMVVMNKFEEAYQHITTLKGYTLYISLESCTMCLARLIFSRINQVLYVSEDAAAGMIHKIKDLPPIFRALAKEQVFTQTKCSEDLKSAASQIFLINAGELNSRFEHRLHK